MKAILCAIVLMASFSIASAENSCTKAVTLNDQTSPYEASLVAGSTSSYAPSCHASRIENVHMYLLPPNSKITFSIQNSNFDTVHHLQVGPGACPGAYSSCVDDPDHRELSYTNAGQTSIEVYSIVDAYSPNDVERNYRLRWTVQACTLVQNGVCMDQSTGSGTDNGSDGSGSGGSASGLTPCGCEQASVQFCNHDYGEGSGFCEPCSNYSTESNCFQDGLPRNGEQSCVAYCFGSTSNGGSSSNDDTERGSNNYDCAWVENEDEYPDERHLSEVSSPGECITSVLTNCPDATIANIAPSDHAIDRFECICQFPSITSIEVQPNPDWKSCLLSTIQAVPGANLLTTQTPNWTPSIDGRQCPVVDDPFGTDLRRNLRGSFKSLRRNLQTLQNTESPREPDRDDSEEGTSNSALYEKLLKGMQGSDNKHFLPVKAAFIAYEVGAAAGVWEGKKKTKPLHHQCGTDSAILCWQWMNCAECVVAWDEGVRNLDELSEEGSLACADWWPQIEKNAGKDNCFAKVCQSACTSKKCSENSCWWILNKCSAQLDELEEKEDSEDTTQRNIIITVLAVVFTCCLCVCVYFGIVSMKD